MPERRRAGRDLATGRLTSATNPENGTVTYTYNSDGTLLRRIDAKNQKTEYSYDAYKRLTQVRRYPDGVNEAPCQRLDTYYDTNPFDPAYSQYAWGRPTAQVFPSPFCGGESQLTLAYMYSYTRAGLLTGKRLRAMEPGWQPGDLEAAFTYNNEGRPTWQRQPSFTDYLGQWVNGGESTFGYDAMGRLPPCPASTTTSPTPSTGPPAN